MTTPSSIDSRLANIEQAIAALSAEVASIRAESMPSNAARTPAPPPYVELPAPPSPVLAAASARRLKSLDFESLIGRYGILGIAVVAAAAAVGTFLSWAMSHGYLTLSPPARVIAGVVFAIGIAIGGLKLRRTERSFGSSMLGLSLVIVHVCAYAAGPSLGLVPSWVAFLGAAACAVVLAIFAHIENDEPLWCVGFGGAALAPFVTSDGQGSVYALAVYGLIVVLPACFAIGGRTWPIAWRVHYLVSALFVGAAASQVTLLDTNAFLVTLGLPFAIALAGIIPFAPAARKRGALRWLALLAVIVALTADRSPDANRTIVGALIAAVVVWLAIVDLLADVEQSTIVARARESRTLLDWVDAAGIPLVLVLRATNILGHQASMVPYVISALLFAAFSLRRSASSLRDAAAFAATFAALAAVSTLPDQMLATRVAAFVGIGLAALGLHTRRPSVSWLVMGFGLVALAATLNAAELIQRPMYQVTPFTTLASATALLVTAAFAIAALFRDQIRAATDAWVAARPKSVSPPPVYWVDGAIKLAPWVWAFLWVLIELWMAFSASTSMLLLVTYFAVTAVGCVAAGRAKESAGLRQVGLTLALIAAGTAFLGASSYFDFGTRITAYLVTSAFLLGIAYWYRRPGPLAEQVEPQGQPPY